MMLLAVLLAAASPSPDAVPEAGAKEERKICKRVDATQSRLGSKRICKTAAQWADDNASDKGGRDAGRSKSQVR